MLVKFVLYLWKRNLKVTPVNQGWYLVHKLRTTVKLLSFIQLNESQLQKKKYKSQIK